MNSRERYELSFDRRRRRERRLRARRAAALAVFVVLLAAAVAVIANGRGIASFFAGRAGAVIPAAESTGFPTDNPAPAETDGPVQPRPSGGADNAYFDGLSAMLGEYPGLRPVIDNINIYPDEILDLVIRNPETVDFAAGYVENRFAYHAPEDIDISADAAIGGFPHFLQWDPRWGYDFYGDNIMGISGCGPTSLAMVIVGLTGDVSANPLAVADYAMRQGYYSDLGTSWGLFTEGAADFGLSAKELSLDENVILNELRNGRPIIVSMRPGDFTTVGHIVVLRGVSASGKILVLDSNNIARSEKEWDISVFMTQAKNLWSFSAAGPRN